MTEDEWMSVEQVATRIGVSARRVLTMAHSGELTAYQTGGTLRKRWRFRRVDVERWLESRRNKPEDER